MRGVSRFLAVDGALPQCGRCQPTVNSKLLKINVNGGLEGTLKNSKGDRVPQRLRTNIVHFSVSLVL